jgi:type II restriction enzyme
MNCVESLNKSDFSLNEIYDFEKDLEILHPENKNIKPKIRQQLQFLRDKGYLEFLEKGKYRVL